MIRRLPSNELALDTVLVVSPGQDIYDLRVDVEILATNEQFSVVITALEGDTELFTSDPITVTASTGGTGTTAPVAVTMTYSGPGATAVAVTIDPDVMALAPGSSGTFTATVTDESGATVTNVPVSWSTGSGAVATVTDGGVATGMGAGATPVVVTTPTGLTDEASLYVASGQLAFVRDGHVVVGDVMGTVVVDQTPEAEAATSGPAWGPDGSGLYYVVGGAVKKVGAEGTRGSGQWPAVSPDGAKVATEQSNTIHFTNEDGTGSTTGPGGEAPAWTPEGTHLVVGGGSIEEVKADGSARTTLSSGSGDRLPAVSASGRVAFVTGAGGLKTMDADGSGKTDVLPEGVTSSSRPTWSVEGGLLVFTGSDGLLYIVAADGSAPPAALPLGAGTDPAWQPAGPALSPPALLVESLDPARPVAGLNVDVVGAGFDWIIPSNTHVFFPGPEGEVEGVVRQVTETEVTALVPDMVVEGTLRVQTRTGEATIAFDPAEGSVLVTVQTTGGEAMEGLVVHAVLDGDTVASGTSDADGHVVFSGLGNGEYEILLTAPSTHSVVGDNPQTATVALGVRTHVTFEMRPVVQRVTIDPEEPTVEVGGVVEVTATPVDVAGDPITSFTEIVWAGVEDAGATGNTLVGSVKGEVPSEAEGAGAVQLTLDGLGYQFAVTVTSHIEGFVTQDPPEAGAVEATAAEEPATEGAQETALEGGETVPAVNVTIQAWKDDVMVAEALTDGSGYYKITGLLAGTYHVKAVKKGEYTPVPAVEIVVLGDDDPKGHANFHMSRAPVASVEITPAGGTITAFDNTLQLVATPKDSLGQPLAGRTITWTSSDESIATVDANGKVTAHSNGTAEIEAEVEGKIDNVDANVDQEAVSVDIYIDFFLDGTPYEDSVFYADTFWAFPGDAATLKATAKDANGYDVEDSGPNWSSTNEAVATIGATTGDGNAITGGTTWVIADLDGVEDSLFLEVRPDIVGDVYINVHVDLVAFQAGGYGRITGSLYVSGAMVPNLDGMESLLWVTGDVVIDNNPYLTDITGLRYLTIVEGDYILRDNSALLAPVPAAAPPQRTSAPRLSAGEDGPQLAGHLDPKPGFWLLEVGGDLIIENNNALTNLDFLSNLLVVWWNVEIGENDNLQDVDGLTTLEYIDYDLVMWDNESLVSMNAFPALDYVGYGIYLEEAGQRLSFSHLWAIPSELYIGNQWMSGDTATHMTEVGFPALQCVMGGIWVWDNARLETLDLPALEGVSWTCGGEGESEPVSSRIPGMNERASRGDRSSTSERVASAHNVRTQELAERRTRRAEWAAEREARLSEREERDIRGDEPQRQDSPAFENGFLGGPELGSGDAEYPYLDIQDNWALTSLDVSSLEYVEGTILFWYNPEVTSLRFPALYEVGWDLEILENDLLDDLRAPILESVGERGSGSLAIFQNPDLPSFNFPNLAYIDDGLVVAWNNSLASFSLAALEYTGGDASGWGGCGYWPWDEGEDSPPQGVEGPMGYGSVYIEGNDLSGGFNLTSLQDVDEIHINWNDGLTTIPSMPMLPEWLYLDIDGNPALTDLANLSIFTKIYHLRINNNDGLTSVTGLENLQEVGVELRFYSNNLLTSISLPALTSIEGNLYVDWNYALTSITLDALTHVGGSGGWLQLYGNSMLTTASFSSLTTVDSGLYIYQTALADLNGFSALTSDLTSLYVQSNTSLRDLSGLSNLGDADGTDPIITGSVYIQNNTGLTDAAANAFLAALDAKFPGTGTAVVGPVFVNTND
ncbi:Ig-like domain-containing protein [Gemmatimonadota bacterium]